MEKITEGNYLFYKKIYKVVWEILDKKQLIPITSTIHPVNVLERYEEVSKKMAIKSLKIGMNDGMRMIKDLSIDSKKKLDLKLKEENLGSLSQLIFDYKKMEQKILERGKIKNMSEYRIVKEVLNDMSSQISFSTKEKLIKMIMIFEKKESDKKSGI